VSRERARATAGGAPFLAKRGLWAVSSVRVSLPPPLVDAPSSPSAASPKVPPSKSPHLQRRRSPTTTRPPARPPDPRKQKNKKNKNRSDKELAKFEAFLNKEECLEIGAIVRPRARLAYPMDRHKSWEGVYVLYCYAARRPTAKAVQLLLSSPEAGSEDKLMRHITFCKY